MHQPLYKDAVDGHYTLPWVRLHAVKDYLHMAEVLADYPKVKATFNFVPSLVEQLNDYASGKAEDAWESICRQDFLTDADKRFMLKSFFSISAERFIRRYPRYWLMLQMRNQADGGIDLFAESYWRDLSAWFNLAWIEPRVLSRVPELAALVKKGSKFTASEVELILSWHHRLCGQVMPAYRQLLDRGQIEISTSPYYHPILPLLLDVHSAHEASPNLLLPNAESNWRDDARAHLLRAREAHFAAFGAEPTGLWPSEGSVSQQVVDLLTDGSAGQWAWAATDEAILAGSLDQSIARDADGHLTDRAWLYQPYRAGESELSLIFRDRAISDRIGFVYRHLAPREAANDLIHRLHVIRDRLAYDPAPHLVPIILDGENCWEEYPDNGDEFLRALYAGLSQDPTIETVSLSDYVRRFPPTRSISRVKAGSWIFGNLETWVGEAEQNRAWEYLSIARQQLVDWEKGQTHPDPKKRADAWRELYVAEGSDWFWWYYSRNKFGQEQMFDKEFRTHLANVYHLIELPVPGWLLRPISGEWHGRYQAPSGYVSPRLDADRQPDAAWTHAGSLEAGRSTGSMQQGSGVLRRLYFGYNPADVVFRIEANEDLSPYTVWLYIATGGTNTGRIAHITPDNTSARIPMDFIASWQLCLLPSTPGSAILSRATPEGVWEMVGNLPEMMAKGNVVEVEIPLARLGIGYGQILGLQLALVRDERIIEALPTVGDEFEQLSLTLATHG